jgi:heme exporter protein C
VQFWATLHQGTSISLAGGQKLNEAFLYPLVVMLLAFFLTFLALLLVRVRTEIRLRRARAMRLATAEM